MLILEPLKNLSPGKLLKIRFGERLDPVFRMQQVYFLIFMGKVIPKILDTGGQEDTKRICNEEGSYELSIKYHEPPSIPIQNEQSLMREWS